MEEWVLEKLQESDMLLIGIGEEFEERSFLKAQPEYEKGMAYLDRMERQDLLPLLAEGILRDRGRAVEALRRLHCVVADKNYFLVSTCQTDIPEQAGFPEAEWWRLAVRLERNSVFADVSRALRKWRNRNG